MTMTSLVTVLFISVPLLLVAPPTCVALDEITADITSGIHVAVTTPTPTPPAQPRECVCPPVVVPRETGRKTTHSDKERKSSGDRREIRRRDGEYWLVPPFLIGATSVFVVYVTVQCIYLHCYAKKKITGMTSQHAHAHNPNRSQNGAVHVPAVLPTIIINDDPSSSSYSQAFLVPYDGQPRNSTGSAFSEDGAAEAQPFLMFPEVENATNPRRCSLHLAVPAGVSSAHRTSVCSAGPVMENSSTSGDLRAPRGSICYLPVGHAFSVPPHNGFVYPQGFLFARNTSYRQACTTASASDSEQSPQLTPVFVAPYFPGFKPGDEEVFFSVGPQQDGTGTGVTEAAPAQTSSGSEEPQQPEATKQNGLFVRNNDATDSESMPMVEIKIDDETSPLCGT